MLQKRCVLITAVMIFKTLPGLSAELLVSDRVDNRILRFDAGTGSFLSELVGPTNALSSSDLDDPAAMALTDEGVLLVASRGNGKVLQFDADTGAFLGEFANGINGPSGLLVDAPRNQLLVSEFGNFDGELIRRFDMTTGESLDPWGAGTGPTGRSDLAFGPDGLLYVGSFFDGRILRFDPDTGAPQPTVPGDTSATFSGPVDGFAGANGMAFHEDRLYAVGLFTFNVFQFDQTSGAADGELIPADGGGLFFPSDVAVIPSEGSLLVSSLGNDDPTLEVPLGPGYIGKYDLQTGAPVEPFFILGAGDLVQPSAMILRSPTLLPGDADQDLDFDQLDLVMVQIAGKYLTSEPATWGEGDWNGAPGGSPGNPPVGDGVFDAHDIIAALTAGAYGTGPYAAETPQPSDANLSAATFDRGVVSLDLGGAAPLEWTNPTRWASASASASPIGGSELDIASRVFVPVPEPATFLSFLVGVFCTAMVARPLFKQGDSN